MVSKNYVVAVVGASNDEHKYGNIVLRDLASKSFKVIPVNPKEKEIFGLKVYSKLGDLSDNVDLVVFVVPPKVTESILLEVKKLGIKSVWMQPGSESDKAIEFCHKNNIECVHNSCIMIQ